MARHKSRERAIQVLFQIDQRKIDADEALRAFYYTLYSPDDIPEQKLDRDKFMEHLVHGTLRRLTEIDDHLTRHARNWKVERMASTDRCILRLAVFEMMQAELAPKVVIDEAIELAKRFSGDESVKFVNGVLDAVRKSLQAADPAQA
jgi:N utilization substance protein B